MRCGSTVARVHRSSRYRTKCGWNNFRMMKSVNLTKLISRHRSEQPAGSNSRQRRKERRAAERADATTGTPITTQSSGNAGSEPVSMFQQEMDRLAAARDDFCHNPPRVYRSYTGKGDPSRS
eukprot:scaffold72364_cov63-Cyclotella_meneghiniana.AAC.1